MKTKKKVSLILVALMCVILTCCCACSISFGQTGISVVSISKTSSTDLADVYTIVYSDGSSSTLEVANGRDGADGKDVDIDDLYAKYLQLYPDATYEDFLSSVLQVNASSNTTDIHKALQSSAKIYTEFTESYRVNAMFTTKETAVYLGSSVIYKIDSDYTYFITNYHVVYDSSATETNKIAKKIVCYLYGSEGEPVSTNTKSNGCTVYDYGNYAIECEYVGGSITADLAIVKAPTDAVKAINPNVQPVTFAKNYHVGDTAIAIGNPEGEGISVTQGIVSVDNEYIHLSIDGTTRAYRSARIDTSIYNGSSGGGLFDINGELIGITNAGDGEDQNVNYAIPLEIVKSAVENIMRNGGSAKKITLGIEVVSTSSKYVFDAQKGVGEVIETVCINKITSGSISEKMGLQADDVLIAFVVNGVEHTINRNFNIGDMLFAVRSGDVIGFKISRGDQTLTTNTYTVLPADLNQIA